jgi:uncharacterized phage protein (TIGR02218 family)
MQLPCSHVLFGLGCNLDNLAYEVSGACVVINSTELHVPNAALHVDGWYSGGYVTWVNTDTNVTERRFILLHVGQDLQLDSALIGIASGATVKIYPGCDRTLQTCHDKFSNNLNYGGVPWVPLNNPFGTNPVY